MWYKLLIVYMLAFPALLTSLYFADRALKSAYGRRLRRALKLDVPHHGLPSMELAVDDNGQPYTLTVIMVERFSP